MRRYLLDMQIDAGLPRRRMASFCRDVRLPADGRLLWNSYNFLVVTLSNSYVGRDS